MMTQATFDMCRRASTRRWAWFDWIAAQGRRSKAGTVLDPRDLSDHLKRDLGYLDGRQPRQRR